MAGTGEELMDKTAPVRAGEELDLERLEKYIGQTLDGYGGAVAVEQFPSGHSNLTYLLKVGDRELVLRRPPFGSKVKTAHDMGREYRVLSHLQPVFPRLPRVLAYCEDPSVLGAPFYLMERVRGLILRRQPPERLALDPETVGRLCESFIDCLAELHAVDWRAAGLGDMGKPEGYVERQVRGWIERYKGSQTDEIPAVEGLSRWLIEKMPPTTGASVIHNDYKYDNLVLDPADPPRIIAVLDWEMSTIGDPLMDLGNALGYWTEAGDSDELKMIGFGPTTLPGSWTRRALADRYAEKTGRSLHHFSFYYSFGLFRIAVIIQQIYYRYAKGLTKDERFASLILGVHILMKEAAETASRSHL